MDQVSFTPEDNPSGTLTGIAVGDLAVVLVSGQYSVYHAPSGSSLPLTTYADFQDAVVLAALLTADGPLVTEPCVAGQGLHYLVYSGLAARLREARQTVADLKLASDLPGNPLAANVEVRSGLTAAIATLNGRGFSALPAVRGLVA